MILKNKDGHLIPIDQMYDYEEFTLIMDNGIVIHNEPIRKSAPK